LILGLLLVSGLVAAACGGSSSADPLAKPQFLREADAICRDAESERDEALKEAGVESTPADLLTTLVSPIEEMIGELDDLGSPVGDDKEVQAIIDAFERGVEKLQANPEDVGADIAAFAEANKLSEKYGLTDCRI
jgi:hypothetical protein